MKRIIVVTAGLVLFMNACRTPKDVAYFQGIQNLTEDQLEMMNQKYVPRICIDDALIINVTSPDRASTAPFAPPPYGYFMPGEAEIGISATTQNLFTYLVDEFGYINFPVLGRLHVAGMSVNEVIRLMEDSIRVTSPSAVVSVQIANFKVSIIGEVRSPDTYFMKTPRLSIIDLIAKAGDLTIMADRKNVWIHRDNNGEKIHRQIDLTDPMIFASPYFYLQQNDVVYVMPNDAQKRNALFSNKDATRINMYSAIITSISIVITAILTIRSQNM